MIIKLFVNCQSKSIKIYMYRNTYYTHSEPTRLIRSMYRCTCIVTTLASRLDYSNYMYEWYSNCGESLFVYRWYMYHTFSLLLRLTDDIFVLSVYCWNSQTIQLYFQFAVEIDRWYICTFSLLLRFTDDTFDPEQAATIGNYILT
jgi:hypothetical protein